MYSISIYLFNENDFFLESKIDIMYENKKSKNRSPTEYKNIL
jgi:hypothetical protein